MMLKLYIALWVNVACLGALATAAPEPYPSYGYTWENNNLGITDTPPEPWLPISVKAANCRLLTSRYLNIQSPLPEQLEVMGVDLFAKAPSMVYSVNQNPVQLNVKGQITEQDKNHVSIEFKDETADYALTYTSTIEFDGLFRAALKIVPKKNRKCVLDAFSLNLYFKKDVAKYYSRFVAYDYDRMRVNRNDLISSYGLLDRPVKFSFYPTLWMGNSNVGLEWVCESDISWSGARQDNHLFITPEEEWTRFTASVIQDPRVIPETGYTFEYGLYPTPAKPYKPNRTYFVGTEHLKKKLARSAFEGLELYGLGQAADFPKRYVPLPVMEAPDYMDQETLLSNLNEVKENGLKFIPYGALYALSRRLPQGEWKDYAPLWLSRESMDDIAFSRNRLWGKQAGVDDEKKGSLLYIDITRKSFKDMFVWY